MKNYNTALRICMLYILSLCPSLFTQNTAPYNTTQIPTDTATLKDLHAIQTIEYTIDWQTWILTSKIHSTIADTADATKSLYARQNNAHKTIDQKLPSILSIIIDTLPLSSEYSLSQFMKNKNVYAVALSDMYTHSSRIHHIPSKNFFGITVLYTTELSPFFIHSILPQLSNVPVPTKASLRGLFHDTRYNNTPMYTHLVFSVEKPLTVLEEDNAEPTLFTPTFMPRVITKNGYIVYSPEYFETLPEESNTDYSEHTDTPEALPFQYVYEKNAQEVAFRSSALIIIPIALNNQTYPDIIISNNDANRILGSVVMRDIIRKGKVVFIIPNMNEKMTSIPIEKDFEEKQ